MKIDFETMKAIELFISGDRVLIDDDMEEIVESYFCFVSETLDKR
jgi:hypothetical protein